MAYCQDYRYSYFYVTLNCNQGDSGSDGNGQYHWVNWDINIHYSRMDARSADFTVTVDGQDTVCATGEMSSGSGSHNRQFGSGSIKVYHTAAKTVYFSFDSDVNWKISGVYLNGMSASGELSLPQLAVPPTAPTSVSVSGGSNGWLPVSNPVFNVSWSGASAGTYTITQYNIDVSKDNWGSLKTPSTLTTSNTYGSLNNVSASSLGLSGGETIKVRVAMMTTEGNWKLKDWGGSFKTYTNPTAPTLSAPSSQEIDTKFSISWSGAKKGTNNIAGYDIEARGGNGSTWGSWVRLESCKNVTSYSFNSPKTLSIGGTVYYNTYGESTKFQFRVRTSDGIIAVSSWSNVGTTTIKINSPSVPRRKKYLNNKDETKYTSEM